APAPPPQPLHRVRGPLLLTAKPTAARALCTDAPTLLLAGLLLVLNAPGAGIALLGALVAVASAALLLLYARAVLLGADRLILTQDVLLWEGAFIPTPMAWDRFTKPFRVLRTPFFTAVLFQAPQPLSVWRAWLVRLTGHSHALLANYGLPPEELATLLTDYAAGGPLVPEDGQPLPALVTPAWLTEPANGTDLAALFEHDKPLKRLSWALPLAVLLALLAALYFLSGLTPFTASLALRQTVISGPFPAQRVMAPLVPFFLVLVLGWMLAYRLVAGRHVFQAPGAVAAGMAALYMAVLLCAGIVSHVHAYQTSQAAQHDYGVCADPGPAYANPTLVLRSFAQQIGCTDGQAFTPDPSVLP
ncbi:hypothetical protein, partial [Acidocella sp.]|uniref:hypothetical protein n=1 Tax=Acidocella sp. TaxID=50710 RepID=UPI00260F29F8